MAQDQNDRTVVERIDPLIGTVVDRRYRIDIRIAAGGFGAIYKATHVGSGHEVALKVLHRQLATDRGVEARFRREGATLTTLRSPYTITAYEIGEAQDGILFIVMELLQGVSLFDRFRAEGPFEWKRVAKIARMICNSLQEAHALGIVHRDLKPTNLHLERIGDEPDHVKVLDFGIAKIMQDSDFDASDLTNAGQMIGTLDYMSPEQMVGEQTTGQTDIYTLGIVMYEMIAGVRPFAEAATAMQALAAILKTKPVPLWRRLPVPESIDRIVMKCLEREAKDRWADVAELGAALDALLPPGDNDATRLVPITSDLDEAAVTARSITAAAESTMLGLSPPSAASLADAGRGKTPTGSPITTLPGGFTPPPILQQVLAARASQPASPGEQPRPPKSGTTPPPIPRTSPPTTPPLLFGPSSPQQALPPPGLTTRPAPGTSPPPFGQSVPQPVTDGQGSKPILNLNAFAPAMPVRLPPTPTPAPPLSAKPRPPSQPPAHGYDMSGIAARDAAVRRAMWIIVLIVAGLIGVGVASQL